MYKLILCATVLLPTTTLDLTFEEEEYRVEQIAQEIQQCMWINEYEELFTNKYNKTYANRN